MRALLLNSYQLARRHSLWWKAALTLFFLWLLWHELQAASYRLGSLAAASAHWPLALAAALLLAANVGVEAWKFRYMLGKASTRISFASAIHAVLAGAAAGIVTPNRVGEYAGRL